MKTKRKKITATVTAAITNKGRLWMLLVIGWLCTTVAMPLRAQCPAENKAFKSGEQVVYDLYFNWKFIWKKVGLASLTTNSTTFNHAPAYRMNLLSTGSKQTDFFFKMRDTLTCYITDRMEPLYFRKAAEEGKRYTVDEAWFSYKDGVSYVKQRRTYRDGTKYEMEYNDSRCIFDMLSICLLYTSQSPRD
mgnify:FL=1